MPDQQKIYRILRFINLLTGKRKYTTEEIQERLDLSERSVYRYLSTFEKAGFFVDRDGGKYRLETDHSDVKSLKRLFHFTEEEVFIFWEMVDALEASVFTKKQLLRKLNTLYDINALKKLAKSHELNLIKQLKDAMEAKRRVQLCCYRSSNSNHISDRVLDVFEFTPDYQGFWGYEYSSNTCKQFKVSRVDEIILLDERWTDEKLHHIPFTDAFGISTSDKPSLIKLRLRLMAYNLLIEEFPLAKKHIEQNGEFYLLSIPVAGFHGIGRFVMGLAGEIDEIEPQEFKVFLREQVNKINW